MYTAAMKVSVAVESWPIRGTFAISRGPVTGARVVVAKLLDGEYTGRGECLPYGRYGETVESVQNDIESARKNVENGITKEELQTLWPAGGARNALDSALWDLEAKRQGRTIWQLLGIEPSPRPISITIGLDTPETMADSARSAAERYSIVKIKLGAEGDEERLRKIRIAAPKVRLIVDPNEGWNKNNLEEMVRACEAAGVELIEQPLRAENDEALKSLKTSIKVCADESAHTSEDIEKLADRYHAVNIKLDKTGGLTEALAMVKKAKEAGLMIMVGCHVSTSLSMAPATVLAQSADYVDLDGPLLLERDRQPGLKYENGLVYPTTPDLWG